MSYHHYQIQQKYSILFAKIKPLSMTLLFQRFFSQFLTVPTTKNSTTFYFFLMQIYNLKYLIQRCMQKGLNFDKNKLFFMLK